MTGWLAATRPGWPPVRLTASILLSGLWSCGGPGDVGHAGDSRWIDEAALQATGFGRVSFVARDGSHLTARIYRSTGFEPARSPVWFVLHGASRDVDRYIGAAAPVAERHGALAIAIHFSAELYPTGSDYTLGIQPTEGSGERWRAPPDMLYAEIERVFDLVVTSLSGRQPGYYLFGHSAGAQFTHRLLTFLPQPRVLGAVAANAGWYTLPVADDARVHSMPYGLIGGPVDPDALAELFGAPLVVLLGEYDTTTAATDDLVRGTPAAEAQGANRLERGRHYFAVARARAAALNTPFAWRLAIAPLAGHDAGQVVGSAGFLTFVPEAKPCDPGAGGELVITEILADPPAAPAGDANRDGKRHPADDEFVEIVNRGDQPVCLAGWTMGDAGSPDRHVFPLGPALAPGGFLLVFGGGVPTGTFGGALVQWSAGGLSLQNAGDVLTLRAPDGTVVQQVSWGDCAGAPCAADHWPGELGIGGSVTRSAEPGASWAPHAEVGGATYSPGFPSAASAARD